MHTKQNFWNQAKAHPQEKSLSKDTHNFAYNFKGLTDLLETSLGSRRKISWGTSHCFPTSHSITYHLYSSFPKSIPFKLFT